MRRGPIPVTEETRGNNAHEEVALTVLFQEVSFGFGATQLKIINEASKNCQFSFDGSTVDGTVLNNSIDTSTLAGQDSVWVRVTAGIGTGYVRAY